MTTELALRSSKLTASSSATGWTFEAIYPTRDELGWALAILHRDHWLAAGARQGMRIKRR